MLVILPYLSSLSEADQDDNATSDSSSNLIRKIIQLVFVTSHYILALYIFFFPVVRKCYLFKIAFHSIDRPKDRP